MTYLERRDQRLAFEDLRKHVIFGLVISTLFVVVGVWNRYFVIAANDLVFGTMAIAGGLGWIVTLVLPSAWGAPERALGFLLRKAGGALFAVLLTAVYALLIVPVGVALRHVRGSAPIVAWDAAPPTTGVEGWRPKDIVFDAPVGPAKKTSLLRRFFAILEFFARRKQVIFLPLLVILLSLGVVLFFVKSSALAPFIYTLF